jgi:hypothetical protein
MNFVLQRHHSSPERGYKVSVKVDKEHSWQWNFSFEVTKTSTHEWALGEKFSPDSRRNWGLWNEDVVEIFFKPLSLKTIPDAYFEMQLSPSGRAFEFLILKPRQIQLTPWESFSFFHRCDVTDQRWLASWSFRLPEWCQEPSFSSVTFGAFACLNSADVIKTNRQYFSLRPNTESNPDFHRPELFIPLS